MNPTDEAPDARRTATPPARSTNGASVRALQAANDELQSANEALRSAVDALTSINRDLKARLAAAGRADDDLQNLIASTDVAAVFVDGMLHIRRFTPRALEIFRLSFTDLGRPLAQVPHHLLGIELADAVAPTLASQRVSEREVRSRTGPTYLLRLLPYRTTDGVADGAVLTFIELTQRATQDPRHGAALSAEADKRSALQAANAMKDEFLAVLSHELKNPLNLIQMKAELLTRLPEVRDNPAVQRAADTIRRTVHSQAKIIDDLLDLSRVHTGKFGLTRAPVPLRPLMERIVEVVRSDAAASALHLAFELPDEALTAYGDFVRIEQILWNLLSNALKFTPPGGTVTVRLVHEPAWARIEVEDTGQGIEPGMIDGVFDMFRQADTRVAREKGGLGIGLALVKSLTELHGGRVAVRSGGLGQGTCFSVWLPLSLGTAPAVLTLPQQASPLAGLRLLVVDDTADTLETFALLLELEGAVVTRAESAPQALALADTQDFDLLLSDVAMPGMDGYQLIAALRQRPRQVRLPAVAVTGFGRQQDQQRALAAGFNAHIGKPVSIEALRDLVADLLPAGTPAGAE